MEIGVDNDNYVEITSGLSEGDTVYVGGNHLRQRFHGLSSLLSAVRRRRQHARRQRAQRHAEQPAEPDFGGDFGGGSMGGSSGGGFGGMRKEGQT